jgi:hypothetical protein
LSQGDTVENTETGERFIFVCPDEGGFSRVQDKEGAITYIMTRQLRLVKRSPK